jgi:hypothetical protein
MDEGRDANWKLTNMVEEINIVETRAKNRIF